MTFKVLNGLTLLLWSSIPASIKWCLYIFQEIQWTSLAFACIFCFGSVSKGEVATGVVPAQTQSSRPCKVTKWGHCVLKHIKTAYHYRGPNWLWKQHQNNNSALGASGNRMSEQLYISLSSLYAMPSVGWSGLKHITTGLRRSGNILWSDECKMSTVTFIGRGTIVWGWKVN